jgi:hypothetical protein
MAADPVLLLGLPTFEIRNKGNFKGLASGLFMATPLPTIDFYNQ